MEDKAVPGELMTGRSRGIVVDAAHSMKDRRTEIQGVDLATGKYVFYKDFGNQTVNIGEFLAIVEAAKYIIRTRHAPQLIYSDSTTATAWFKSKRTASGKRNKLLQKAEIYLKACALWVDRIEIRHWDTQTFGENPADFGNKAVPRCPNGL